MPTKKNTNKSIFVSSTFRDMQAERDALRDFVLPRVNEFAAQYGRAVEIIDLRWGVDTASVSEAEQNHKVLRACLDEIERSRPFFLGLIGDRYGWTPPRQDMEAALNAARFSLDNFDKSVTALEIEFGVLRSENPPVCLFYFRESPDYSCLPEELRRIYRDEAEGLNKLTKLKDEIRARFKTDIKNYTAEVHEKGLSVSKDWSDMVVSDIIIKLREEWGEPADAPPDWKEQERGIQETFRESRTAHFAGRTAAIADMAAFCLGGETTPQILMLQGEAGSGKSGLLCKVMDEIEDQCLLLPFNCGISSRSSLVENMLRYFISLICEKMAFEDDSDSITKFQELKERFTELLFIACQKKRVVAVVDALDQFAGSDEARRMLWISGRLPQNFRLLCSIIDGPETEAVRQLGGKMRSMPSVDTSDETAIIHGIAARHHKQIAGAVIEHILKKQTPDGAQAAQNPLYLSLITQNLVMMDRYELDTVQKHMEDGMSQPEALAKFMRQRIDEISGDAEDAYLAILSRLENLIGRDFVRGVCGLIAVSRGGLRESDLENTFKELGKDFNPADFAWLRQMLRDHVSLGDMQQWDFSHQNLRRALRKDRAEELKRLNDGLVVHFRKVTAQDNFAAREIIYHLCAANRPDIAAEIIAEYYDDHRTLLARGLADVYTEHEAGSAFLFSVPNGTENVERENCWRITETIRNCLPMLPENTRPFRIELMLAALATLEGQDDSRTQWTMAVGEITVSDLYRETGDSKKAEEYYQKSIDAFERIYRQTGDMDVLKNLSVSWDRMGEHLRSLGRVNEAGEYYRKSLDANERIYGQTGDAEVLRNLSVLWDRMGKYLRLLGRVEEAEAHFQKSLDAFERIYRQTGEVDALRDLSMSWAGIGDRLRLLDRVDEAGEYYRKSLDANERIYGQTGGLDALKNLSVSLGKMGDHLSSMGYEEEAGEYYRKSLDTLEQIYRQTGTVTTLGSLSVSWSNIGDHLSSLGRTEEAGGYYQKSIDALEQIYRQTGTVDALRGLSASWVKMGDHLSSLEYMEEAGKYYQKSIDALEQVYGQTGTVTTMEELWASWVKMGDLLSSLGREEEAGEYYRKSLGAREQIYRQTGTVDTLWGLSASWIKMGDHLSSLEREEEAGEYYQKSIDAFEQIYRQTRDMDVLGDMSWSLSKMGDILSSLGRVEEAGEYYQKALDARKQIYGQSGTVDALNDLIISLDKMGDLKHELELPDEAHTHRLKALELFEQLVKLEPSAQEYYSYYRDKAMHN
jgi:tetratricopeptide (TPR) repeat protein